MFETTRSNALSPLTASQAYCQTMALVRTRLLAIETAPVDDSKLARAERLAFQIRKIVESVSFAALSAVEHRNQKILDDHRTKDADKLLAWLEAKKLLQLPSAQRVEASSDPQYRAVYVGVATENLDAKQLKGTYGRASALIHERHPERLTDEVIDRETAALEDDARCLRSWLWLHMMFLRGEAFLVQMSKFGTSSFFVSLGRVGDLPGSGSSNKGSKIVARTPIEFM